MGAVKKGVIPRNTPLATKCTQVNGVIQGKTSQITSRNFANVQGEREFCQEHDQLFSTHPVLCDLKHFEMATTHFNILVSHIL